MPLPSRLLLALPLLASVAHAQPPPRPAHAVFLLGNTAQAALPPARLQALRRVFEAQAGPFTVVHLGDVVANEGLAAGRDSALAPAQKARIEGLLALVRGLPQGRMYFVPGDKDWANSGPAGLKAVRRLERYIEAQLPGQNAFVPSNGCPGPEVVTLAPGLRLAALNTPWFTHPFDRPEAPDTDCKTLTQEEFREQLEDVLDAGGGGPALLVGHHPVVTTGPYGGYQPLARHLSPPVLGTVYAAWRQNVGTPRDLASPGYRALQKELLNTLRTHPGTVYAAAHDFSLQLAPLQGNYHVVSGSVARREPVGPANGAAYNQSKEGFTRLDYAPDGTVRATFLTFENAEAAAAESYAAALFGPGADGGAGLENSSKTDPAKPGKNKPNQNNSTPSNSTQTKPSNPSNLRSNLRSVVPGPEYASTFARRLFIGPVYRAAWTTPVSVPTLDLGTELGGLRPTGKGGGRQTTSLKLIAADSSEYVFRSVDKDVTTILPPELRNSVAADVLRDVTATAFPYSNLAIGHLLDQTDILHARPRLFRLPDSAGLGPYRARYAGLLGTLEDSPKDPKPNRPGFGGSDEITRSFGLFRKLYKDHDNRVDAPALARARAFDMLVADFGKHEDNWKWAAYKTKGGTTYQPIPRDRDQSFTRWNGLLTYLADRAWALPSIEGFGADFEDMKSLNWPARHLDRALLQPLGRDDWQQAARYLQTRLTPAVIDAATARFPTEVQAHGGQDINRRLKSRLAGLPQALDRYYRLLARRVDVVGSNKGEVFEVNRLPGGEVRVRMFDRRAGSAEASGPALFERTFRPAETREICLYGLAGKDVFRLGGTASKRSVLVRVVGGDGQDRVADSSRAPGLRRRTRVYDVPETALRPGPETADRRAARPDVNRYDRREFAFDGYRPTVGLGYNGNDGLQGSLGITFVRQGFRKPGFKSQYSLLAEAGTGGQRQFTASTRHRHVLGQFDAGASASYGSFFPFYNFFGLGNATVLDQADFDNRRYRARYKGLVLNAFAERPFWQRSLLRVGPTYEYYTADFAPDSYLGRLAADPARADIRPNTGFQRLLGLSAVLDLDLRDRPAFARRGVRLRVQHESYRSLNGRGRAAAFGLSQGFAEYYGTARLGVPITLVVKGGGAANYGADADIPFYKFANLGLREGLRGHYRNRFTGDASAYVNTEVRLALGQVKNGFLPFFYGLYGFYDQGRVYYEGASPGGWRRGYGGGFYVAPVAETLALNVSYQLSNESALVQVGVGFRIDK